MEVSTKGALHANSERTTEKTNDFTSVLDKNYSSLPDHFNVSKSLLSRFAQIRKETERRKAEIPGVLYKDDKNELKIKVITKSVSNSYFGDSSSFVPIDYRNATEEGIKFLFLSYRAQNKGWKSDVYFTTPELAQKYNHLFKELNKDGREVIIGTPLTPIHSHPSGNMPSVGDFNKTLLGPSSRSEAAAEPEIVVTSDWVYFLIPTKQTPDMSSEARKLMDLGVGEPEEDRAVEHLSIKSGMKENDVNLRNAVRLKTITDMCLKYNVGFYVLAKGENEAKRIV